MRKIILKFVEKIKSVLKIPGRLSAEMFMGREYVVSQGTFRKISDYDDAWFFSCASHAEYIFDVGANVGFDALMALISPSVKEVILIDANAEALTLASGNLIRNSFGEKTRFILAFAGEKNDEKVKFWTVGSGAAGSCYAGHAITAAKKKSFIEVTTVCLDYLETAFKKTPDFIKVDVEGAEYQVLLGSKVLASKKKTRFLIEMHSNPELSMEQNAKNVLSWCHLSGYKAWYLAQGVELTSESQIKQRGRCHLLLQPENWPYPDWLKDIPQSSPLAACANRPSI